MYPVSGISRHACTNLISRRLCGMHVQGMSIISLSLSLSLSPSLSPPSSPSLLQTYLPRYPNPRKKLLVTCIPAPPNPKCYVCSPKPEVQHIHKKLKSLICHDQFQTKGGPSQCLLRHIYHACTYMCVCVSKYPMQIICRT